MKTSILDFLFIIGLFVWAGLVAMGIYKTPTITILDDTTDTKIVRYEGHTYRLVPLNISRE